MPMIGRLSEGQALCKVNIAKGWQGGTKVFSAHDFSGTEHVVTDVLIRPAEQGSAVFSSCKNRVELHSTGQLRAAVPTWFVVDTSAFSTESNFGLPEMLDATKRLHSCGAPR